MVASAAPGADPAGFAYKFLNGWSVFTIWQFVVIALGVAALNRKISSITAVAVILGTFAVVMAGVAAVF